MRGFTEDMRIWHKLAKRSEESSKYYIPKKMSKMFPYPFQCLTKQLLLNQVATFRNALLRVDLWTFFRNGGNLQIPNSSFILLILAIRQCCS